MCSTMRVDGYIVHWPVDGKPVVLAVEVVGVDGKKSTVKYRTRDLPVSGAAEHCSELLGSTPEFSRTVVRTDHVKRTKLDAANHVRTIGEGRIHRIRSLVSIAIGAD